MLKILFWMGIGFDRHTTSEHLMVAIIARLCEDGHTVHVVQKDTGGPLPAIPKQLQGQRVTTTCIKFTAPQKNNFIIRYICEMKYAHRCIKAIENCYDAVFIQSTNIGGYITGMIKRRCKRARITFNVQDVFPYNAVYSGLLKNSGLVFKALAAFQRRAYYTADSLITISEDMCGQLVADGVPPSKISVIYNWGYRDALYTEDELDFSAARTILDQRCFNVVYAGNIGVMQNVDTLVECARLMSDEPDVHFHIVGDGVYKDKLQEQVRKYQLTNISFWPKQPPELAPGLYATADVNVVPLIADGYKTALPSKLAVCLACQKPIILAIGKESVLGKQISSNADCQLISAEDPAEMMAAIHAIRKQKHKAISQEYYQEKFGYTTNSARYAQVICQV